MTDHYTISLCDGKYTVIDHRDRLEYLRDGRPAQPTLPVNCGVIFALARRIEELEVTIKAVLDGTLDEESGLRASNGMESYGRLGPDAQRWEAILRNALEQKQ